MKHVKKGDKQDHYLPDTVPTGLVSVMVAHLVVNVHKRHHRNKQFNKQEIQLGMNPSPPTENSSFGHRHNISGHLKCGAGAYVSCSCYTPNEINQKTDACDGNV